MGDTASDVLIGAPGPGGQCEAVWVHAQRVNTTSTHGTGCSLSSAIATLLGRGYDLPEAVRRAKVWLTQAIRAGDRMAVGTGHGPLDHMWAAHDVFARAGITVMPRMWLPSGGQTSWGFVMPLMNWNLFSA